MWACVDVARDSKWTSGKHASTCALSQATAGHNDVRDVVFAYASEADPASELEPMELVSSRPRARPADVLTPAAIPGRVVALDIGITSPAVANGLDATEVMFQRKVEERTDQHAELEAQNIEYRPLVWTCFGRPHHAVSSVLDCIAKRVARRRGCNASSVLRKLQCGISVCLARRAARMSLACWPLQLSNGTADDKVAQLLAT